MRTLETVVIELSPAQLDALQTAAALCDQIVCQLNGCKGQRFSIGPAAVAARSALTIISERAVVAPTEVVLSPKKEAQPCSKD